MKKEYFLAKSLELTKDVYLDLLFDKNQKIEELVECKFIIRVCLHDNQNCKLSFNCKYVNEDKMIPIDEITSLVKTHIDKMNQLIESVDSGINLTDNFFLEQPSIVSSSIDIRRELRRSLQNITEYKLQPFIIDLYNSVLIKYKGTDTLQKRKFKKMLEAQEDAMRFYQMNNLHY